MESSGLVPAWSTRIVALKHQLQRCAWLTWRYQYAPWPVWLAFLPLFILFLLMAISFFNGSKIHTLLAKTVLHSWSKGIFRVSMQTRTRNEESHTKSCPVLEHSTTPLKYPGDKSCRALSWSHIQKRRTYQYEESDSTWQEPAMTKRKAEQTYKNLRNEQMKVKQAKMSLTKAHLAAQDLQNCTNHI